MNIFCIIRIIVGIFKNIKNIYSSVYQMVYSIDKVQRNYENSGNIGLKNPQENLYADLLKTIGDLKTLWGLHDCRRPIDCNEELKRKHVSGADYELCTALLTMLLRRSFFNGFFLKELLTGGLVLPCSGEDEGCFECRSVIL